MRRPQYVSDRGLVQVDEETMAALVHAMEDAGIAGRRVTAARAVQILQDFGVVPPRAVLLYVQSGGPKTGSKLFTQIFGPRGDRLSKEARDYGYRQMGDTLDAEERARGTWERNQYSHMAAILAAEADAEEDAD